MHPFWVIDKPDIFGQPSDSSVYEAKGWIASLERIDGMECADPALSVALRFSLYNRDDVRTGYYPHLRITGFKGSCPFDLVEKKDYVAVNFKTQGREFEIILPVHQVKKDPDARKAAKMRKIFPLLRCPNCGDGKLARLEDSFSTIIDRVQREIEGKGRASALSRLLLLLIRFRFISVLLRLLRKRVFKKSGREVPRNDYLVCSRCAAAYPVDNDKFNFLPNSLAKKFGVVHTENVSANSYDGIAMNYIYKNRNGLILDCGAGLRDKCFENVVNYEIVPYESTNVLGVVEKLPFRDNSFDAVFSFAVLEHVKDPFLAAREMVRVLKPGGTLYCQAPFLSPLHGYPNHYFNMSSQGLNRLFEGLLDVQKIDVLNFGQPIFTLSWFLNLYLVGLPPEKQQEFRNMKVSDILLHGDKYLGAGFVRELSDEVKNILACANYLVGKKK
jgi:SAM-dependent methyltransferase